MGPHFPFFEVHPQEPRRILTFRLSVCLPVHRQHPCRGASQGRRFLWGSPSGLLSLLLGPYRLGGARPGAHLVEVAVSDNAWGREPRRWRCRSAGHRPSPAPVPVGSPRPRPRPPHGGPHRPRRPSPPGLNLILRGQGKEATADWWGKVIHSRKEIGWRVSTLHAGPPLPANSRPCPRRGPPLWATRPAGASRLPTPPLLDLVTQAALDGPMQAKR